MVRTCMYEYMYVCMYLCLMSRVIVFLALSGDELPQLLFLLLVGYSSPTLRDLVLLHRIL